MTAAKFWVALIGGMLTAVIGVWPSEWGGLDVLTVASAALTAAGVYLTPNRDTQGRHVATSDRGEGSV